MVKFYAILLCAVLAAPAGVAASIEGPAPRAIIPASRAVALDGHAVILPRDLAPATILILGFSSNSADPTTAWEKQVRATLASPPSVSFYDMPMLAEVPSLIRPIVLRSIRKQVPDFLKPNFVPLTEGEAGWKQIAAFTSKAPDAAYILLVDRNGAVHWQTSGSYTPAAFNQLATETRKLLAESH